VTALAGLFFSADYVPTGGGGEKDEGKTVEKTQVSVTLHVLVEHQRRKQHFRRETCGLFWRK
jgi:hypothetical protein